MGINNLRIFAQAQNLFTITSFSGLDYETPGVSFGDNIGLAAYTVPHVKSYSIGINLDF